MRRLASIGLALAGLALAPWAAASESSIQCEGGIVSVGDSRLDLLAKCGRPTLVDERLDGSAWGFGRPRSRRWRSGRTTSARTGSCGS